MYKITIVVNEFWRPYFDVKSFSFLSATKLNEKGLFNSACQITFGYNPNLVSIKVYQEKLERTLQKSL